MNWHCPTLYQPAAIPTGDSLIAAGVDRALTAVMPSKFFRLLFWLLPLGALNPVPSRAAGNYPFPLRVSDNHRHLEGADHQPFLVVGDTAWSLIAQLNDDDVRKYLDDRAQRGFTAIIVNLIEHKFATHAPADNRGVAPFVRPGDIAHPNPEYFDRAHRIIEMANSRGLCVFLCAAYLGWGGGDEGFYKEIDKAGPEALRAYGQFLGTRFKDLPNIVWMMGGDYSLKPDQRWTANELVAGLHEGGAKQLVTAHGGQTTAAETFGEQPWLALNTTYRYQQDLYTPLLATYRHEPVRPFVLIETIYEGEHDSTPAQIRREAWWAMLCGATGQFFGNNPIWHFDGPTLFKFPGTWQTALDSTGSRDIARLGRFFKSRPWYDLVPDIDGKMVTEGGGSGITHVTAAHTPDHRLAILYVPADDQPSRELTLDLSHFPGPATVTWFNPAKDVEPVSVKGTLAPAADQKVQTPGANGAGANDWVLVLEVR